MSASQHAGHDGARLMLALWRPDILGSLPRRLSASTVQGFSCIQCVSPKMGFLQQLFWSFADFANVINLYILLIYCSNEGFSAFGFFGKMKFFEVFSEYGIFQDITNYMENKPLNIKEIKAYLQSSRSEFYFVLFVVVYLLLNITFQVDTFFQRVY